MPPEDVRLEDARRLVRQGRSGTSGRRTWSWARPRPASGGDVAFHAQQAAEKALKAVLAWRDEPFRKTHSIEEPGRACATIDPGLGDLVDAAVPLTEYAWKFRYPGDAGDPTHQEAERAVAAARKLVVAVEALLTSG